ncbi:RluA family pseudouridine synthase [Rarobacter faecitabidus]|uniref:Pseudouridine synthase n=1 Tax=Rarobacter faecitabidus TaxID=13243 RepID=A0A542ZW69_RARFA|nr:RluA family pseudouridine synthase [Rarobacter faecitabidus]TQL64607.1 ribosomal large subunit pseudouridine synthase D [Rarobacter faecitabidus]
MSAARGLYIPDGIAGERVDTALSRMLGFSRAAAVELIAEGRVNLDGRSVRKSDRVPAGGWLEVDLPEPDTQVGAAPEPIEGMDIVYDDDDIVVVNKPVGVAAHTSPGWTGPTVLSGLAGAGYRIATSGPPERQGIVHRLDVGTSGLMMVAKSELAYSVMKRAFKQRTVTKVYHALAQGHLEPMAGTVDAPIGRHPGRDFKFAVTSDGKPSITHYQVIEMLPGACLAEVHLETGRTHQIRVHMAALKHPLVGDLTYGADPTFGRRVGLEHQWLHAVELGFAHPRTGEPMRLTSDYPAELERVLEQLRP